LGLFVCDAKEELYEERTEFSAGKEYPILKVKTPRKFEKIISVKIGNFNKTYEWIGSIIECLDRSIVVTPIGESYLLFDETKKFKFILNNEMFDRIWNYQFLKIHFFQSNFFFNFIYSYF
jgi:hypothetical protein